MDSELRIARCTDEIEVWYNNTLVATVTGIAGPGLRVASKFPLEAEPEGGPYINAFVVKVKE